MEGTKYFYFANWNLFCFHSKPPEHSKSVRVIRVSLESSSCHAYHAYEQRGKRCPNILQFSNIFTIIYSHTLSTGIDGQALHRFQNVPIMRAALSCSQVRSCKITNRDPVQDPFSGFEMGRCPREMFEFVWGEKWGRILMEWRIIIGLAWHTCSLELTLPQPAAIDRLLVPPPWTVMVPPPVASAATPMVLWGGYFTVSPHHSTLNQEV